MLGNKRGRRTGSNRSDSTLGVFELLNLTRLIDQCFWGGRLFTRSTFNELVVKALRF